MAPAFAAGKSDLVDELGQERPVDEAVVDYADAAATSRVAWWPLSFGRWLDALVASLF